jgi:hypothetical protein
MQRLLTASGILDNWIKGRRLATMQGTSFDLTGTPTGARELVFEKGILYTLSVGKPYLPFKSWLRVRSPDASSQKERLGTLHPTSQQTLHASACHALFLRSRTSTSHLSCQKMFLFPTLLAIDQSVTQSSSLNPQVALPQEFTACSTTGSSFTRVSRPCFAGLSTSPWKGD